MGRAHRMQHVHLGAQCKLIPSNSCTVMRQPILLRLANLPAFIVSGRQLRNCRHCHQLNHGNKLARGTQLTAMLC
jgi:hypothetical protein